MNELKKILVVDDESVVLKSIRTSLKKYDFEITTASDPKAAFDALSICNFDLVISDILMPGIDGIELLKKIRVLRPDIPVVIITGCPTHETANQAQQYGAYEYVIKPFTRRELRSAVFRALGIELVGPDPTGEEGDPLEE